MVDRLLVIDDAKDVQDLISYCAGRNWPEAEVDWYDPVAKGKPEADFDWSRYDFVFLDVRNQNEYDEVHIPDTAFIPLGQLKERMGELPKDKEIIAFCKISLRGYEACNMLEPAGFKDTKFMDGGVVTWPFELVKGNG